MFRSHSYGFSLVELLVGVVILGVLSLSMAALFSNQNKQMAQLNSSIGRSNAENLLLSALTKEGLCTKMLISTPFDILDSDKKIIPQIDLKASFSGTAEGTKLLTIDKPAVANSMLLVVKSVSLENIKEADTDTYYAS